MMMNSKGRYVEIPDRAVPATIRFDTPRANQGQAIEVSYGQDSRYRDEAGYGDPFQKVRDASGVVRFYAWHPA